MPLLLPPSLRVPDTRLRCRLCREIALEYNAVGENRGLLQSPRIRRIVGRERSECGTSGCAEQLLVTAHVADEPRHRGLPVRCRSERVRIPALPSHRADRGWPRSLG